MPIDSHNEGFDSFRRERRRMQAKKGAAPGTLSYDNEALRALEQVEEREVRDQQLTREVHDFFAAATRQAASIVERVARDAQAEAGARVEREMEAFLIDSLARMNNFIVTVLQTRRNAQVAETHLEPTVANLVGQMLDEFRWEGTAEMPDKHIGQDPFATLVEDVQREFRAQMSEKAGEATPIAESIEHHLVAEVDHDAPTCGSKREADACEAVAAEPAPRNEAPATVAAAGPDEAVGVAEQEAEAAVAAAPTATPVADTAQDLDRFKSALKALVRQGVMKRAEASAAWQARLVALGLG